MTDTEYRFMFTEAGSRMKVVRGISLFIIALGLFVIGCLLGFEGHEFFYPGESAGKSRAAVLPEEKIQVSEQDENIISADTSFVVIEVNMDDQTESAEEVPVPAYYMGMDRETFEKQIETFDRSPSLAELQKGFQGSEIRSFSGSRVELCKFYQEKNEETTEFFYLAIQDNKVVVYREDGETVYMETDIPAQDLPSDLLQELLMQRRVINTEEDLYDFLESYSS